MGMIKYVILRIGIFVFINQFLFFANRFLFSLLLIKFLVNLTNSRKIDSIRNNVSTKHNQIHVRARGLSGGWVGPGSLDFLQLTVSTFRVQK